MESDTICNVKTEDDNISIISDCVSVTNTNCSKNSICSECEIETKAKKISSTPLPPDCIQELKNQNLYEEFKLFYYLYRFKQKLSGAICGGIDGGMTGYYIGMKWGGAGGFIVGGIAQVSGMIIPTITGFTGGIIQGIITDRKDIIRILNDYRCNFGEGGLPPTHGSFA